MRYCVRAIFKILLFELSHSLKINLGGFRGPPLCFFFLFRFNTRKRSKANNPKTLISDTRLSVIWQMSQSVRHFARRRQATSDCERLGNQPVKLRQTTDNLAAGDVKIYSISYYKRKHDMAIA